MRKQALPPFPVFKKPLPCCPVLGLSIPFPLSIWWSNILEQCSSHLLTPRDVSKTCRIFVCFVDKFGAGFSRSREMGDSHHQMGALCHNPTASSSWSMQQRLLQGRGADPWAPIPAPHPQDCM